MKTQHICPICGACMYESGGQIHWRGHLLILFGLLCLSLVFTIARWHENLMALPFLLYLGYLVYRTGNQAVQFLRGLLRKYR